MSGDTWAVRSVMNAVTLDAFAVIYLFVSRKIHERRNVCRGMGSSRDGLYCVARLTTFVAGVNTRVQTKSRPDALERYLEPLTCIHECLQCVVGHERSTVAGTPSGMSGIFVAH
jgi:hypothetical protein